MKGSGVRKRGERMFYCTCVYMRRSSLIYACSAAGLKKVVSEYFPRDLRFYMWSQYGWMKPRGGGYMPSRYTCTLTRFCRQQRYSLYPPSAGEMRNLFNL
jgi:hypothetical protein